MPRSRAITVTMLVAALGCATAPPRSSYSEPPRMVSTSRPVLQTSMSRPRSGEIDIRVMIDATGKPDMRTLQVTGGLATENKDEIARWIETARFEPAKKAGQPVPGEFHHRIASQVRVRRQ
jgi:hypothetical protein